MIVNSDEIGKCSAIRTHKYVYLKRTQTLFTYTSVFEHGQLQGRLKLSHLLKISLGFVFKKKQHRFFPSDEPYSTAIIVKATSFVAV